MRLPHAQFGLMRSSFPDFVLHRAACCCLWFSLPLSIWLVSGWIGLALHWQAELNAACLLERITSKPQRLRQVL